MPPPLHFKSHPKSLSLLTPFFHYFYGDVIYGCPLTWSTDFHSNNKKVEIKAIHPRTNRETNLIFEARKADTETLQVNLV